MKVLVVGSGGREHALCWKISRSPLLTKLYCAPGNGGIAAVAECVDIAADRIDALVAWAKTNAIDFVVVGPEAPLVAGLVDKLEIAGIKAFGPTAAAAALEGSKGFTKELCAKYGIPGAAFRRFTSPEAAKAYVRASGAPIVVKADGLAAGKGVVVARSVAEALAAIDTIMGGELGEAGASIVVEEFLTGEEASFHVLVDGRTALPLAGAQDHKAAFDGDQGPNTGGMGAYSPAPVLTAELAERVMKSIILPTVAAMTEEGRMFKGVLYAGLMIEKGVAKLLEYNCRFGDPECQVLMARLDSDLLPALIAAREGTLDKLRLAWRDEAAVSVVMAAKGYPGPYRKGTPIRGLDAAAEIEKTTVFHAGTARREGGRIEAVGGRVLGVTALGTTVAEAQARAYRAVDKVVWPDGFCRRDIGWRAVARETRGV